MAKANKSQPTKKKVVRRTLFWGVGIGVIGLIVFGPRILAANFRPWLESQLSEETGFDVTIEGLSAGWLASATIDEIQVKTKSGATLATVTQLQTEKSLLGLMFRDEVVGGIFLREVVANIPLEGEMLQEVSEAVRNIDIRRGVLGQILNPDSFAILRLEIEDSQINLLAQEGGDWENVVPSLNATVNIDHSPARDLLDIRLEETPVSLNSEIGDWGLKFVAPVLAGALNLQGDCSLAVSQCKLQVQEWKAMDVEGVLQISEASADIEAKLIRGIAQAFAEEKPEPELGHAGQPEQKRLNVKLAENNVINFLIKDGIVHHEGLAFGLPDLLPNMLLQSEGDVGFDSSLDFELALEIPFEKMGDSGLLSQLGSPALTVPVTGTFDDPEIGIGDRQLVRGFVRNAVLGLTDDQVDVEPWLNKLAEKGLLKNRRDRRQGAEQTSEVGELEAAAATAENANAGGDSELAAAGEDETGGKDAGAVSTKDKDSGQSLLDRIRQRREEAKGSRQEAKDSRESVKQPPAEAASEGTSEEKPRRKFFGRRKEGSDN